MQSDRAGRPTSLDEKDDLEVELVVELAEETEPVAAQPEGEPIQLDREQTLRDLKELQELSMERADGKHSSED